MKPSNALVVTLINLFLLSCNLPEIDANKSKNAKGPANNFGELLNTSNEGMSEEKPNIILITLDDLDQYTFDTLLHNKTATGENILPQIKKYFIDSSTEFSNNFITTSVCCPSRASILTGQFSHNHGVLTVTPNEIGKYTLDETNTLAVWLQNHNYATTHIGKYITGSGSREYCSEHLEIDQELCLSTYFPPGWTNWFGSLAGEGETLKYFNFTLNENGHLTTYDSTPEQENYHTDVLSKLAEATIDKALQDGQPFFISLNPITPHIGTGLEDSDTTSPSSHFEDMGFFSNLLNTTSISFGNGTLTSIQSCETTPPPNRYRGSLQHLTNTFPNKPSTFEGDMSDKPRVISLMSKVFTPYVRKCSNKEFVDRLEAMRAVDDLVGNIFKRLSQLNLLNNTYIIFTSDNGYLWGEHGLAGKVFAYEESIKVPLFVKSPGQIQNQKRNILVANIDLAPTILELTHSYSQRDLDGMSYAKYLLTEPTASDLWRKNILIEYITQDPKELSAVAFYALRTSANELYVNYINNKDREYYLLEKDPFQLENAIREKNNLPRIKELEKLLQIYKNCAGSNCQ